MTAVCLGMGVDWIWVMLDWARLQHILMLMRGRVGVTQAGLGLGNL